MDRPSVYESVGGARAFEALAAAHHKRCLDDPVLSHPFSHGVNPDHVPRLAAYWAEVFGGPDKYSRSHGGHRDMVAFHAGQGAGSDLGDRFVACFLQALDDANFPPDEEIRATMRAYIEWAVDQVMSFSPPGSEVPQDLPAPRWSWDGLVIDRALKDR